jgi:hypothetical protein
LPLEGSVAPQGERCLGNLAGALHSEVFKLYVAGQLRNRIGSPNPNYTSTQ